MYIYVCIYIYIDVCLHKFTYIQLYDFTFVYIYIHISVKRVIFTPCSKYIHIYICMHICIYIYMCTYSGEARNLYPSLTELDMGSNEMTGNHFNRYHFAHMCYLHSNRFFFWLYVLHIYAMGVNERQLLEQVILWVPTYTYVFTDVCMYMTCIWHDILLWHVLPRNNS